MKPPVWRQDRALYPFAYTLQTRYSDQDTMGHVNNISVARFYDEGRSRFMQHIFSGIGRQPDLRIVTASSFVSYGDEVFYPADVEVVAGILKIGTASFTIGQALIQGGRYRGLCDTVFVQASKAGSEPLNPALRAVLETLVIREP